MEDSVEILLDEILELAEAGTEITPAWLRERYGERHADTLRHTLQMAGVLQRRPRQRPPALGPYRLLHEIGAGGMGTVYLAEVSESVDGLEPGERVAVKLLHPEQLQDERVRERFLREARLGQRIRHPEVVRTLAAREVETPGGVELCLVMEYVPGPTLHTLVGAGSHAPEALCRFVGRHLADALDAIHAAGIVHCDVKPKNVVLAADGRVMLMDLGVASATSSAPNGLFAGSLRYAAPEQFDPDAAVDLRADLYAVGKTLLDLAGGAWNDEEEHADVPERYSPFLCAVIDSLLQREPGDRFESAAQLRLVFDEGERSGWWQQRAPSARARQRPVAEAATSELHGRRQESARLELALFMARSGRGQAVLIEGEAGIGKSRLVQDFLERQTECEIVQGAYAPGGERSGGSALAAALRAVPQLADLCRTLPSAVRGACTAWLELVHEPEPADAGVVAGGVVQILRALASRKPLIVWIDDLHEAGAGDRRLLATIVRALRREQALFVGTYRPVIDRAWCGALLQGEHVGALSLGRLDRESMRRLLADAFQPRRLAASLLDRLAKRADGVPLLGLAQLRSPRLQDQLQLRPDGTWNVPGDVVPSAPQDLVDAMKARIAELDPDGRRVLEVASCLGQRFDAGRVATALGWPQDRVGRSLEGLRQQHHVLVEDGADRFAHPIILEVVYDQLETDERREHHARIATMLGDEPKAEPAVVCLHALRGGRIVLARRHVLEALRRLDVEMQWERMAALAKEACAYDGLLEGVDRLRVLRHRARALSRTGRADERQAVLEERLALASSLALASEVAEAEEALAGYWSGRNEAQRALTHIHRALEGLAEDEHRRHAQLYLDRSHVLWPQGQHEAAIRAARTCLQHAALAGDLELEADAHCHIGAALWQEKDRERVKRHFARALELTGHLESATPIVALGHLALLDCEQLELARAQTRFQECFERAVRFGQRRMIAITAGRLGHIGLLNGATRNALEHYGFGLSECEDIDDRAEAAYQYAELCFLFRDLGAWRSVREQSDKCIARAREIASSRFEAVARHCLAHVEWHGGAEDIARREHERACELMAEFQDRRAAFDFGLQFGAELYVAGQVDEGMAIMGRFAEDGAQGTVGEDYRMAEFACWRGAHQGTVSSEAAAVLAERGAGLPRLVRMRIAYLLWCAGGDGSFLQSAQGDLLAFKRDAPEGHQAGLLRNVPLYRLIHDGIRIGENGTTEA